MKTTSLLLFLALYPLFYSAQITLDSTTVEERTVIENLDVPWDMALASDGWIWLTELDGTISRLNPANDEFQVIYSVPGVEVFGFSAGMHSIVLHPDFTNTPHLFVHYLDSQTSSRIMRYTFDEANGTLIDPTEILIDIPGASSHNGSRMVIVDDKLIISIGDGWLDPSEAQNLNSLSGNMLRMNLDGSIPDDNPIAGSYIWSWGHRNPQGLCVGNGIIYSSEHGTNVDDEINIIEMNRNYGWPIVEGYCNTASEMEYCEDENVKEPIWTWAQAIAPGGIDYYGSDVIPEWEHSLMLAVMKDKQLIQLKLNDVGTEIESETHYLTQEYGRIRDVLCYPDGRIFFCTSNHDVFGDPIATDDRIIELKKEETIGIADASINQFKAYPNPSQGQFRIQGLKESSNLQLLVKDLNGLLVHHTQVNLDHNLDLSHLSSGFYFVEIIDEALIGHSPIIIKH